MVSPHLYAEYSKALNQGRSLNETDVYNALKTEWVSKREVDFLAGRKGLGDELVLKLLDRFRDVQKYVEGGETAYRLVEGNTDSSRCIMAKMKTEKEEREQINKLQNYKYRYKTLYKEPIKLPAGTEGAEAIKWIEENFAEVTDEAWEKRGGRPITESNEIINPPDVRKLNRIYGRIKAEKIKLPEGISRQDPEAFFAWVAENYPKLTDEAILSEKLEKKRIREGPDEAEELEEDDVVEEDEEAVVDSPKPEDRAAIKKHVDELVDRMENKPKAKEKPAKKEDVDHRTLPRTTNPFRKRWATLFRRMGQDLPKENKKIIKEKLSMEEYIKRIEIDFPDIVEAVDHPKDMTHKAEPEEISKRFAEAGFTSIVSPGKKKEEKPTKAVPKPAILSAKEQEAKDAKYARYMYRVKTAKIKPKNKWGKFIEWVEENHPELTDEKYVANVGGVKPKTKKPKDAAPAGEPKDQGAYGSVDMDIHAAKAITDSGKAAYAFQGRDIAYAAPGRSVEVSAQTPTRRVVEGGGTFVALSDWQLKRIKDLVGVLGDTEAEVAKNIVTMWLYNDSL